MAQGATTLAAETMDAHMDDRGLSGVLGRAVGHILGRAVDGRVMTRNHHHDGDISTHASKNSAFVHPEKLQDREWVENALRFWDAATPRSCGKSRRIIAENITRLRESLLGKGEHK